MTKDEFNRKFADELRGLLAESFAQASHSRHTDHSANGAMIVAQLRRAADFLDRVWDAVHPKPVASNGVQPNAVPVRVAK